MDQQPPRLKHQGGWLAAAIDTLENELPSRDQLEQLHANVCSGVDPDDVGSGVRKRLRRAAVGVAVERAAPPRSRRVRRAASKSRATKPRKPRVQPSWHTVACAAVAGGLFTLALSSPWRDDPRSTRLGSLSATVATTATDAKLPIQREVPVQRKVEEWPASAPAAGRAARAAANPSAAPAPPARRPIPSVTLESALGPALPDDWETPSQREPPAYRDADLWWLHPKAAGGARLKLNSNPISKVSVDGKELGLTPIVDAWVPAGKHTVTFDHPVFGRKRRVVEVTYGATEVVAVWFGNDAQRK